MVILLSNRLLSPLFHESNRWSIKSSPQKKITHIQIPANGKRKLTNWCTNYMN